MYDNISNFQIPEYKKQTVESYKGNPHIEALPNVLSDDEFANLVNNYPQYNEEERKLSIELRLHSVELVYECFQALDFHQIVEKSISNIIREGYVYRNPVTPEFTKSINLGFKAIQNKNIDMYNVNSIRRITACSFSLIGSSGMGKTSIIDKILFSYPKVIMHSKYKGIDINTPQLVWLKLECPFDGSIKGLCLEFFFQIDNFLGTNYYKKYGSGRAISVNAMMPIIAQIAKNYGIGVLVIDEIQNLNVAKSGGVEKMLNFFMSLINMVGIPMIFIGTPDALPILKSEFRQARRSSGQGDYIIKRLEKDEDWDKLLNAIFKYQWTNKKFYLTEKLSDILYEESTGIIDTAIKLYVKAQKIAIMNDIDIITPGLIKKVSQGEFNLIKGDIESFKSTDEDEIKSSGLFIENEDDVDMIMKSNIERVKKEEAKKQKVKKQKEKNVVDVDNLDNNDLRKITNECDSNYENLSKEGYIKGKI